MRILVMAAMVSGTVLATGTLSTGEAEARQSTKSLSCSGVRALINRRGAVVLSTKSRFVYDRFVRNFQFCPTRTFARKKSVPTTTGSCRVTYCDNARPLLGFAREGTGGKQGFR